MQIVDELERRITSQPTYGFPPLGKQYTVEEGASEVQLRSVLLQVQEHNKPKPIEEDSGSFYMIEKRYEIITKRFIAVEWSILFLSP